MARETCKEGNGALTLNGSSQTLAVANGSRRVIYICNTATSNKMWLAYDEHLGGTLGVSSPAAAASTGIMLTAGQTLVETEYKGAIRIIGTNLDVVSYIEV